LFFAGFLSKHDFLKISSIPSVHNVDDTSRQNTEHRVFLSVDKNCRSPPLNPEDQTDPISLNQHKSAEAQENPAESDDTVYTMIMVVVIFLICNFLALVINIVETFMNPDRLLLNFMSDTSNFLVVLNSSINIIIYLRFDLAYRRTFREKIVERFFRLPDMFSTRDNFYEERIGQESSISVEIKNKTNRCDQSIVLCKNGDGHGTLC